MEKDSIPDDTQGDLEDHSLTNDSADTTGSDQSSNENDNDFFDYENNEEAEVTEDDAPSQTQDQDDDTSEDEESEDNSDDEVDEVDPALAKWAKSQNMTLTTPTEIALAKRVRDTQKSFHEKSAEAKAKFQEATKEVSGGDQITADSMKLARMEFFMDNSDAKELEGAMYDIALKARDEGDQAGFAYYQTPAGWKTLLKIAKAENAEVQSEDSILAARADERKNLAKKQQASTTRKNATNSTPTDNRMTEEKINNMSQAEYNAFRAANPGWNPFG